MSVIEDEYQLSTTFAQRVASLYITHPRLKKIWGMLDSIRKHNKFQGGSNSPRHRFVIGLSGVGKTQMMRRYAELEVNKGHIYIDEEGTEIDIRPVVYVNLPDPFTIMELYQSIIYSLGAPQLPGRPRIGEVKRQVFTILEAQKVEMLILDEMDHILKSRFVKNEEAMSAIKHITNHGSVSVICVGTPEIEELRKFDPQHFRRYPPTRLERFKDCDKDFLELMNSIEEQLLPPNRVGFGFKDSILPSLLHKASYGLVGYLTPIIQETYDLLGVFNDNFNEETDGLNLNFISKLEEAYGNIVGDVAEEEMEKMFN
ncbi:TniB family NTP-binding protein [Paenibacillus radicis (ex Xue et al. 2023)]|uniref:TniB family NTP-binding protein n=1 Tax=Paenibacillus radicis (ex Xue et al. 2023) TaxID=2972489 RepID=A0ABT1YJ60_9BACL|nr:TniB family NTP-binding protein [Paenibacillus radicis (ex Xue et al. 2023)]MCR8633204.1 TniB family NTP-binding protein [Paenibacillus radicis (ex Xue et al. 2023)]